MQNRRYRIPHPQTRRDLTLLELLLAGSLLAIAWMFVIGDRGEPRRRVCALEFTPDGQTLVAGMLNDRSPEGSDFDACETVALLATTAQDAPLVIEQSLHSGKAANIWPGRFIDLASDGITLAVGRIDGSVAIWNLSTMEKQREFTVSPHRAAFVQFLPDGQTLAICNAEGLLLWNFREPRALGKFENSPICVSPALSPDGRFLILETISGLVIYDFTKATLDEASSWSPNMPGRTIALRGEWVSALAYAPGSNALALSRGWSERVEIWSNPFDAREDTPKPGQVELWNSPQEPQGRTLHHTGGGDIAFSPDGRTMATAGYSNVKLWDFETGRYFQELPPVETGQSNCAIAFSPDGQLLAIGDGGGCVTLWDIPSGERLWVKRIPGRFRWSIPRIVPITMIVVWLCAVILLWLKTHQPPLRSKRRLAKINADSPSSLGAY